MHRFLGDTLRACVLPGGSNDLRRRVINFCEQLGATPILGSPTPLRSLRLLCFETVAKFFHLASSIDRFMTRPCRVMSIVVSGTGAAAGSIHLPQAKHFPQFGRPSAGAKLRCEPHSGHGCRLRENLWFRGSRIAAVLISELLSESAGELLHRLQPSLRSRSVVLLVGW